MSDRRSLALRIVADLVVACLGTASFIIASHGSTAWFIETIGGLLLWVVAAACLEPSAKMVWVHPLLIMLPELVALPAISLTCHGFECAGIIAFLVLASVSSILLVGISFAVFYIRRWIMRSRPA